MAYNNRKLLRRAEPCPDCGAWCADRDVMGGGWFHFCTTPRKGEDENMTTKARKPGNSIIEYPNGLDRQPWIIPADIMVDGRRTLSGRKATIGTEEFVEFCVAGVGTFYLPYNGCSLQTPPEPSIFSVVIDRNNCAWQRRNTSRWHSFTGSESWKSLQILGPLQLVYGIVAGDDCETID